DEQEGFLAYVEGHYKSGKLNASMRLQYFETGGYDSRIYAYENDLLYSYSTPAFYETGARSYINLTYKFSKQVACWLRWSGTLYTDGTRPGSGPDQLPGHHKTDIRFQMAYNF
ncbi:MAG TPA: hypothetical protein VHK91_07615, partial [Flavisolibacter sp.]|nr:hypothetical protein [Flavisolibacter sp.]